MMTVVRLVIGLSWGWGGVSGGLHRRAFVLLLKVCVCGEEGCSVCENSLGCALMTWPFFCMYIMPPTPPPKKERRESRKNKDFATNV